MTAALLVFANPAHACQSLARSARSARAKSQVKSQSRGHPLHDFSIFDPFFPLPPFAVLVPLLFLLFS